MRVRKMTALMLAGAMTASMGTFAFADEANELPTIDSIKLGEDYTDLTASIKVLTHRTDIVDTTFQDYIKKFNESYPNITIEYEAVTDYAEDIKLRLTTDDWGDICGIPTNLQKNELEDEFISYGDKKTLDENYVLLNNFAYSGNVYGIPSTGNAQGIVYNKKVFEEAGVTELPKTPWAVVQMQEAGDNADDIGYMPFPITVDGKQYASAGPDYCYGINVHSDYDNQLASMIYVKWLTEESNFSYDQGGIPICVGNEYPDVLAAFDGVELVVDNPAPEGEEDLFGEINTESEISLNADNTHVQDVLEHALNGDKTMEEIADEWNQAWTDAQEEYDITPAPYVYGSGVAAE